VRGIASTTARTYEEARDATAAGIRLAFDGKK
jgi:hypothetical protein